MKAAMDNKYHQELRTTTIPNAFSTTFIAPFPTFLLKYEHGVAKHLKSSKETQSLQTGFPNRGERSQRRGPSKQRIRLINPWHISHISQGTLVRRLELR